MRTIYGGAEGSSWKRRFVMTGERRAPRKGEFYLSGAIPEAWQATSDYTEPFYMLRELREDETVCDCCGQKLPVKGRA